MKKFYYLEIGVRAGELEFTIPSVCALRSNRSVNKFLEERAKTFYGGEMFKEDSEYYFNGGEHCTYSNKAEEITEVEFNVLKKFMPSHV